LSEMCGALLFLSYCGTYPLLMVSHRTTYRIDVYQQGQHIAASIVCANRTDVCVCGVPCVCQGVWRPVAPTAALSAHKCACFCPQRPLFQHLFRIWAFPAQFSQFVVWQAWARGGGQTFKDSACSRLDAVCLQALFAAFGSALIVQKLSFVCLPGCVSSYCWQPRPPDTTLFSYTSPYQGKRALSRVFKTGYCRPPGSACHAGTPVVAIVPTCKWPFPPVAIKVGASGPV
jgi:hypothetical protein